MEKKRIRAILQSLREGCRGVDEALHQLRFLPFEDLGFAKVDHHRQLRRGFPEVVFGQGKTVSQLDSIIRSLESRGGPVMITRVTPECYRKLSRTHPRAVYHQEARMIVLKPLRWRAEAKPGVVVVAAGTSDLPVAEEAVLTAELMGNRVERLYDVGVAGLHRLLAHRDRLGSARVLVVMAGMEKALPSVVAGLVEAPVIAVPTSIGYGASFGGLTALLSMLNSCAGGVVVVNIDNGFGAGYTAGLINREVGTPPRPLRKRPSR